MVPGVVQEIRLGLAPTSALVKAGHSLRIAVAGHDASTFARLPSTGSPVLTVAHGPAYPSRIELPIVPRLSLICRGLSLRREASASFVRAALRLDGNGRFPAASPDRNAHALDHDGPP
jgi:hypothetical protein